MMSSLLQGIHGRRRASCHPVARCQITSLSQDGTVQRLDNATSGKEVGARAIGTSTSNDNGYRCLRKEASHSFVNICLLQTILEENLDTRAIRLSMVGCYGQKWQNYRGLRIFLESYIRNCTMNGQFRITIAPPCPRSARSNDYLVHGTTHAEHISKVMQSLSQAASSAGDVAEEDDAEQFSEPPNTPLPTFVHLRDIDIGVTILWLIIPPSIKITRLPQCQYGPQNSHLYTTEVWRTCSFQSPIHLPYEASHGPIEWHSHGLSTTENRDTIKQYTTQRTAHSTHLSEEPAIPHLRDLS